MNALADFLNDPTPYPDVLIEGLKRGTRSALAELDLSKADMSDLALVITAQQQQLIDLRQLAATLGAAIPAAEATHGALFAALSALSARIAAVEDALAPLLARVTALEGRTLRQTGARKYLATVSVSLTGVDHVLTWDTPMPDLNYSVVPQHCGGLLGATVVEKPNSRTKTGITYTVTNSALITAGGTLAALATRYA